MIYDRNTKKPIAYSPEEREEALSVSLTALAAYLGYTPVQQGRHCSLKEMDSMVIYNDHSWKRWSGRGERTAGSQIDFMMEFGGAESAVDAIKQLLDFKGSSEAVRYKKEFIQQAAPEQKTYEATEMVMPPKNDNYKRIYAYLIQTRGLSQEVVSDFVHRKLIYEDAVHHNIVYCGYDPQGEIKYAGLRGTADIYGKKFKMDVPGNNKNYGVNIVNKDSSTLLVFESVIDCMSYIDLYNDHTSNKLILGMVEDNPLEQFLKDYDHIKTIHFCLDNDDAAKKKLYGTVYDPSANGEGLVKKYQARDYTVDVVAPKNGKDFNEELLFEKSKTNEAVQQQNHVMRRRGR